MIRYYSRAKKNAKSIDSGTCKGKKLDEKRRGQIDFGNQEIG
jgi:hypothetical protein